MSTFKSEDQKIQDIILKIREGGIQLPDFQRGWVWDEEHIRLLLVSIAKSFPIGAVMLLENGGETRLKPRPIEGASVSKSKQPEFLVLDGQQRLTSLALTLGNAPVTTHKKRGGSISVYFYIDIQKAMNAVNAGGDIGDAFFSVNESKTMIAGSATEKAGKKFDLSSQKKEHELFCFPFTQVLDSDEWEMALHNDFAHKFKPFMAFRAQILDKFRRYEIPSIILSKQTKKEAVCLIFEKVNTGGVSLTVFELLTAIYAVDSYNLREDWYGKSEKNDEEGEGHDGYKHQVHREIVLKNVKPDEFLQAISLVHTYQCKKKGKKHEGGGDSVSAQRKDILSIPLESYKELAPEISDGFVNAGKFLYLLRFINDSYVPYQPQIVPLAAILSKLGDNKWREPKHNNSIARWFWCGVFGAMYRGATETRMSRDLEDMFIWRESGYDEKKLPGTIETALFRAKDLDDLKSKQSAAYKALSALLLLGKARDFFYNITVDELEKQEDPILDVHHIFPKKWCDENGVDSKRRESIINKTPISSKINKIIGCSAPSKYLKKIEREAKISPAEMDEILRSHQIDPTTLRKDDFEGFYKTRRNNLLKLIESAGVKIIREDE